MRAEGWFSFDGKKYEFNSENGALATLDWGRGVWTYDNTWYWGSGQMIFGGRQPLRLQYRLRLRQHKRRKREYAVL